MRYYRFIIAFICLTVAVGAAVYKFGAPRPKPAQAQLKRPDAQVVLRIDGMDCVMCAAGLQNSLRTVPGVHRAEVSFQDKRAVVEYDPAVVDAARFEKLIANSGFKVAAPAPARP